MRKVVQAKALVMTCLFSIYADAHGVASSTAKVEYRSSNIVELKIQFELPPVLNYSNSAQPHSQRASLHDHPGALGKPHSTVPSNPYRLPVLASLSEDQFALLYKDLVALFERSVRVYLNGKEIALHARYPSQSQMFELVKQQFAEDMIMKGRKTVPYTFSDRRFYQQFYYDFKLASKQDLPDLEVVFPNELGSIYVTYSQSVSYELHSGERWKLESDKH